MPLPPDLTITVFLQLFAERSVELNQQLPGLSRFAPMAAMSSWSGAQTFAGLLVTQAQPEE